MKRLALVLLLGAAIGFTPAVAQADNITVGNIVVIKDVADAAPYGDNASGGGTWWLDNITNPNAADFMTFCIEKSEVIKLGKQYVVGSIEPYAVKGGNEDPAVPPADQDVLDAETKALYDYFRWSKPNFSGADLQNAFWFFEDEITADQTGNAAYEWAIANVATYQLHGIVNAVNLKELVLVDGQRVWVDRQSVLTWEGVPDGGATLMLLGGALIGLGALRRRQQ